MKPEPSPKNSKSNPKRKTSGRSISDEIIAVDKQILGLVLKRYNLLNKIKKNAHLSAGDEKFIREAWQKEATRISADPDISHTLFSILQKSSCKDKPRLLASAEQAKRNDAYTLAPAKQPVKISMTASVSSKVTQLWVYLAAAAGCQLEISSILQGNALASFIKILEQCGYPVKIEDENIIANNAKPLGRPDEVFHIGANPLSFYVILAHYLGGASRVKIMGESMPPLQNLSNFMAFLPGLGCRLTPAIPKNPGLPVRVECSGLLPEEVAYPSNMPGDFALALCLAALFYETPFAINLSQHPDREDILEAAALLFKSIQAPFQPKDYILRIEPFKPRLPEKPVIPMDVGIASFLLGLSSVLKGKVALKGEWPKWRQSVVFRKLLSEAGINWQDEKGSVIADNSAKLAKFVAPANLETLLPNLPPCALQFFCALACCACLAGGRATLPGSFIENAVIADFINAAGLTLQADGNLILKENPEILTWNAPDAYWGMAFALVSCAIPEVRPLKLGNPGIVTALWKNFWQLYNGLPDPESKILKPRVKAPIQKRRRIITDVISTPPPEHFDDE